ncbi:hypothetical protein [Burkholderia lata]|uniref:hypothetical protein n=1 Tax=Burkholderia lata (strain ATCC 17760 / DSM 23089 / LMG 22485 / NCIMB 9086 / R18194 / 383) TaxID=482957 RepID=UPI0015821408|nr:hypothetical protein [Burkholderia lata]
MLGVSFEMIAFRRNPLKDRMPACINGDGAALPYIEIGRRRPPAARCGKPDEISKYGKPARCALTRYAPALHR